MTANAGYLTVPRSDPQTDGEQDVPLENGNAWRLGRSSENQCCDHPEQYFEEKTVQLKGYEFPARIWAAKFTDLRSLLTKFPEPVTGVSATTELK